MGQGGVGKTAMVLRFTTGEFNEMVRRRRAWRVQTERAQREQQRARGRQMRCAGGRLRARCRAGVMSARCPSMQV